MMSVKNLLESMHKFYSSLWDNIERIKSVLLTLLILLSIFLTWNLWTYTPQNNVLEEQEPFKSAIEEGEKKKLSDIIQPKQIILHENGKHYWFYGYGQEKLYNSIQSNLLTSGDIKNKKIENPEYGITISYPTPIPVEVLKETFNFSGESARAKLNGDKAVEKIICFKENNGWKLQFIIGDRKSNSETDQIVNSNQVIEYQLSNPDDIDNTVVELEEDEDIEKTEVVQRSFQRKDYYWPKENMTLDNYKVPANTIDIELFVKALLPPDVVSKTSNETETTLFLRQRSQIKYFKNREEFTYINNQYSQEEVIRQNAIIQSLDFINSHAGWTYDFYLEHYYDAEEDPTTNNKQKDLTYRLLMHGFPVMEGLPGSRSIGSMDLEYTYNQVTKYNRYLDFPEEDYKHVPVGETKIQDDEAVLNALKRLEETYSNLKVTDVTIGYKANKEQDVDRYDIVPTWFYKSGSSWVELDIDTNETPTNKGG
ncbi:two-component system activity regulator YycH [Pseudalkalibacillus sp. Hm43]|uniref:two-component system activity regulator YycH n=1 Tax=Pseudalkalibacillus sp. Hm43 TaxID=3450742 RepID=UPI003F41EDB9